VALFTCALVEKDKYDWLEHFRSQHDGKSPTPEQVEEWFASKPTFYYQEKYNYSLNWYKWFARYLLDDEIKEERLRAIKQYIGDKMSFVSQLILGLATNFIFIIILGAVAVYVFSDFSPIAWVKGHIFGR